MLSHHGISVSGSVIVRAVSRITVRYAANGADSYAANGAYTPWALALGVGREWFLTRWSFGSSHRLGCSLS